MIETLNKKGANGSKEREEDIRNCLEGRPTDTSMFLIYF